MAFIVKRDAPRILYNSGTGNPLNYSGDGSSASHFIGGLFGGSQDDGGWTVTFKIKKAGVLYYSFNLESEEAYDYALSYVGSSLVYIFEYQSGIIQSNGNINVNIDDIITISYSKDGSVSTGFDGIEFDFYIV
jgi:hypothetical protein